jgi:phage terminase large subunit
MAEGLRRPSSELANENAFVVFVRRYRNNPVLFVQEVLGQQPDEWQAEMMMAVARGERRISIRSGHGVGKSTAVSWLMLWFLLTRFPVKVVVTAPTSAQLFDALFAECKRWCNELPEALAALLNIKADRIELIAAPEAAFISARTSRAESPEAMQGVHSEHVLLVADEASGVPEAVFEAASGSMSGEHACTVLLGNPTRSSGFFYDTHNRLKDQWWTRKVSCVDSPRVSDAYVQEMASRYGEGSNAFRIRVLGEFPLSDDDTVIPMELIDAAIRREIVRRPGVRPVWGLDVARFGSDRSALCKRWGSYVGPIQTWRNLDTMQLSGAVYAEWGQTPRDDRPEEILVDVIGLGAGVTDRLRELGLPARGINVSEAPSLKGQHFNLRSELWFKAKAFLEKRDSRLPDDEQLVSEMAAPRYKFTSSGKLQVESKDEMRKRGLPSPDKADAFCLTLAGEAVTALYGTSAARSWSKPIRRNLKGVA